MEKITLSGGNFGGAEVLKSEFDNELLEKTDEQGVTWIYDLSKSANPLEGTFIGTK
jgi:hypothetical protein